MGYKMNGFCFIKNIISQHENTAKEHELSDIFSCRLLNVRRLF